MLELTLFSVGYMTFGLLFLFFSQDIAQGMNRFSVRFYEVFPVLKKRIPLSRYAGSTLNYKASLYFWRGLGVLLLLTGVIFLGIILLYRRASP